MYIFGKVMGKNILAPFTRGHDVHTRTCIGNIYIDTGCMVTADYSISCIAYEKVDVQFVQAISVTTIIMIDDRRCNQRQAWMHEGITQRALPLFEQLR